MNSKSNNKLTIACISDTHGYHRAIPEMPEADILIHSGDITFNGELDVVKDFNDWLGELPYSHKIVIAGNHELTFEEIPMIATSLLTNAHYLYDSFVKVNGFKIWGSPYTHRYGSWAFMKEKDEMNHHWINMPHDADVVVTHGPAYTILDRNGTGQYCGCEALYNRLQIVRPQLHIHGHIHEGYGMECKNGITHINAALMSGVGYGIYNKPKVVEIEK